MAKVVVGTTLPTLKALSGEDRMWLSHARGMVTDALDYGYDEVKFFAAIEHDTRGIGPFDKLTNLLGEVDALPGARGEYWGFSISDGAAVIDGWNRLLRICTGRNLIIDYALRDEDVDKILFLDSDLTVPPESISKLSELGYPFTGGDVPAYCLAGKRLDNEYPTFPVQEHWNTAGFLMVDRHIFQRIQWRADIHPRGAGMTDDPTYADDVRQLFGLECRVRKDLQGVHKPLVPLEKLGHDLSTQGVVG